MKKKLLATLIRNMAVLMAIFPNCFGQGPTTKIGIYLSRGGNDSVGKTVAYYLREHLNKSNRYFLAGTEASANYKIDLASVDINEAVSKRQGEWSAISVVFLVKASNGTDWIYLSQGIEVTGRSRTEETAQEVLTTLDDILNKISSSISLRRRECGKKKTIGFQTALSLLTQQHTTC